MPPRNLATSWWGFGGIMLDPLICWRFYVIFVLTMTKVPLSMEDSAVVIWGHQQVFVNQLSLGVGMVARPCLGSHRESLKSHQPICSMPHLPWFTADLCARCPNWPFWFTTHMHFYEKNVWNESFPYLPYMLPSGMQRFIVKTLFLLKPLNMHFEHFWWLRY